MICHFVELTLYLIWACGIAAIYWGDFTVCEPGGQECIDTEMLGGLTILKVRDATSLVLASVWGFGVLGPVSGLLIILLSQKRLDQYLLYYQIANLLEIHIGYHLFYATLVPIFRILMGYCTAIEETCTPCAEGISVATCRAFQSTYTASQDCTTVDCSKDCVYSVPVRDDMCTFEGFVGRAGLCTTMNLLILFIKGFSILFLTPIPYP